MSAYLQRDFMIFPLLFPDLPDRLSLFDEVSLEGSLANDWFLWATTRRHVKVALNEIVKLRGQLSEIYSLQQSVKDAQDNLDLVLERNKSLVDQNARAEAAAMAESSRADAMTRARDTIARELAVAEVKLNGIRKIINTPTPEAK